MDHVTVRTHRDYAQPIVDLFRLRQRRLKGFDEEHRARRASMDGSRRALALALCLALTTLAPAAVAAAQDASVALPDGGVLALGADASVARAQPPRTPSRPPTRCPSSAARASRWRRRRRAA